jgi:hypothetical protein
MEQSPSSQANSHPTSEEISYLLWNPKVNYRVHKSPPPAPILMKMNPVHTLPPSFLKIHFNIIRTSTSQSSGFPAKMLYTFLVFTMLAACPTHPILFDLIILVLFGEEYKF